MPSPYFGNGAYFNIEKIKNRLEKLESSIKGGNIGFDIDYSYYLAFNNSVLTPILVFDEDTKGILQKPSKYEIKIYKVKKGDTLSSIAKKFDISVSTISYVNNLYNPDYLKIGQELVILPLDGIIHKVSRGETVSYIAKLYGVKQSAIIEINQLTEDGFIREGDILIIPGARPIIKRRISSRKIGKSYVYSGLKEYKGYYIYPTVKYSKNWGKLHRFNAVDIATSCGNPVYASASGIIRTADGVGWNRGYGKYIIIDHPNDTSTLYAHLSKILVKTGQKVAQGQKIGLIGTTGRSTGCHVHFEVRGAKNPFAKY